MEETELEKLKEEKEELLKNSKTEAEAKKLKREIFLLKNPSVSVVGRFFRGSLNTAANIGDGLIGMVAGKKKAVGGKPDATDKKPTTKDITKTTKGKKKYFSNKINALNDCEKGEKVYYDAKEEVYYIIKLSTDRSSPIKEKPKQKPKGVMESMDEVMKNINKEMGKLDAY